MKTRSRWWWKYRTWMILKIEENFWGKHIKKYDIIFIVNRSGNEGLRETGARKNIEEKINLFKVKKQKTLWTSEQFHANHLHLNFTAGKQKIRASLSLLEYSWLLRQWRIISNSGIFLNIICRSIFPQNYDAGTNRVTVDEKVNTLLLTTIAQCPWL